jgi:hypothetical protein
LHNGADDLKSFKCLTRIGVNSPKEMKPELLLKLRPYNWQVAGVKNN